MSKKDESDEVKENRKNNDGNEVWTSNNKRVVITRSAPENKEKTSRTNTD